MTPLRRFMPLLVSASGAEDGLRFFCRLFGLWCISLNAARTPFLVRQRVYRLLRWIAGVSNLN